MNKSAKTSATPTPIGILAGLRNLLAQPAS